MDKNHSQNFSEEKLDRLVQEIVCSTILSDEEIDEIAESPRLWWQVQSRITEEKACRRKHRFFGWRWQWAMAGALVILITTSATFLFFNQAKTEIAAVKNEKFAVANEKTNLPSETKSELPIQSVPLNQKENSKTGIEKGVSPRALKSKPLRPGNIARKLPQTKTTNSQKAEIATEFIALSYLPATDSGQVVRVKVPRSMLVSLGVTTNVGRPSELVNAEVIVGDDGATRAIRFLANE